MALGFSYKAQLRGEWNSAKGFLIAQFESLYSALATLSPLTDNLALPYKVSATLLTDSAGLPRLHQQVRASIYNSAVQALTTATVTPMIFDTAVYDVGGMWNPAFTARLTVPSDGAGTYLVIAVCPFAANAVGQRQLRITKNGAAVLPLLNIPAAAAYVITPTLTELIPAIGGDYFGMDCYQDSGGNLNTANQQVQLTAIKLAAA